MEWVKLVESKREEIVNAGLTAWKNNLNAERIVEVYMTPEGTIDYSTYLHGDNARIPKVYYGQILTVLSFKTENTEDWNEADYIAEFTAAMEESLNDMIDWEINELKLAEEIED